MAERIRTVPDSSREDGPAANTTPADGAGAGDQYWILRPGQLRCLTSPRRMDIIDKLAGSGPLSIRELSRMIGAQPSALYHHIRLLLENELVVPAGRRVVNRRREELFGTPSRQMRLLAALGDPANSEVMREIVSAQSRQMDRDFRRGIAAPGAKSSGEQRNLGFFRMICSPDPTTLAKINAHLAGIAELMSGSHGQEHDLVSLAWVMAPAPEPGAEGAPDEDD